MFNIANSVINIIGAGGAADQLKTPKLSGFLSNVGLAIVGFFPTIANGILWVVQAIMKFVLNIVDLMQYFVKSYWS